MQLTLEGKTIDQVAIDRIQAFEPSEGYYLAFSGGKDSVVLLDLVKRSGVKFDAHYHLTTVDPPEVVKFIRTFPEVKIVRPKETMWQLCRRKKILPTRKMRFCCTTLKEVGGKGRLLLTGIRWQESPRRANRKMLEVSKVDPSKKFLHAIIDWTDSDIWQYIDEHRIPYCSLYREGWLRIGCVMCPMGGTKQMLRQLRRWPKIAQAWQNTAIAIWEARGRTDTWQSGEAFFDWWVITQNMPYHQEQATFDDCLVPFSD